MATIMRRGDRWRAMVRRRGHGTITRTLATRGDAERWARRVEAAIDRGDHLDLREAERTTLAEALDRYRRERVPGKKGARQEEQRIGQWMRDPLARRGLASIRSADVARWRDERTTEGRAPTTIRNALTILSQVFVTAASDWGMEGLRNPVRGVRLPRHRPGRDRRLVGDEEERIMGAVRCLWTRAAFVVAVESAMRQSELLGLRWDDLRGRVAVVRESKNGRSRSVPLSTGALEAIRGLPRSVDGRVFPINATTLDWRWRETCRRAGVRGLRWHDLRREAASRMFERGLTAEQVMRVGGWLTYTMVARYTALRVDDELLDRLG